MRPRSKQKETAVNENRTIFAKGAMEDKASDDLSLRMRFGAHLRSFRELSRHLRENGVIGLVVFNEFASED